MQQLEQLTQILEDAGYIKKNRKRVRADPAGRAQDRRKSAHRHLLRISRRTESASTNCSTRAAPASGPTSRKPYEFGDPFLLDLPKTIMNAVQREGAQLAGAALADRLRGLPHRVHDPVRDRADGRHEPLDVLQRLLPGGEEGRAGARFADPRQVSPRPPLHHRILVHGPGAQAGRSADRWTGTSTTTAPTCSMASSLRGRSWAAQKASNRQIIVITDGEPTAHFEDGQVRFNYPPTPRTFQETLREVIRCTRDGITINTFMLERSPYMVTVHQRPDADQQRPRLRRHARTGSASTSWSTTSPTSANGSISGRRPLVRGGLTSTCVPPVAHRGLASTRCFAAAIAPSLAKNAARTGAFTRRIPRADLPETWRRRGRVAPGGANTCQAAQRGKHRSPRCQSVHLKDPSLSRR